MIGSAGVGAFVALWGFWILLVTGWLRGDLGAKAVSSFVLLWIAGYIAARYVLYGLLFVPYVAVLDVVLVVAVFKRDIKLT
jgi:hypothetical protein